MDVNKSSVQGERLEIVETGRRRRWSEGEKLKIVMESLQSPGQMTVTALLVGLDRLARQAPPVERPRTDPKIRQLSESSWIGPTVRFVSTRRIVCVELIAEQN